ncbi:MAG: cell surface protein SprA [Bacteroidales bacterium]|nr:cell surface protein SprA [Bacteroidales bacterium]
MKFVARIYIICVCAVLSVLFASAVTVAWTTVPDAIQQPEDSIKLQSPLPKETGNTFKDAENRNSGMRLQESPETGYSVEYNAETDEYEARKMVGDNAVSPSFSLPSMDYFSISGKQRSRNYWRTRASETRIGTESSYEPLSLLGEDSKIAEFVDIKPQGAAELNFGLKFTNNHNPRLSKKQQRQLQFDFDNKIQMSVTGSIGDKVSMTIKYDTESQFEFEQEIKLQYEGDEDEIIKNIEVGNVSFPLSSSLISGSSSLFGVKSDLQFGKLYLSGVFSRQRGEMSSISVQGGAQTEDFEIQCDQYDINKHFFLSQFFREHYEESLKNLPEINSGIEIRKVEVWVTQTSSGKEDARNILALTDLGDVYSGGIGGTKEYELPENGKLYKQIKNMSGIRNINTVSTTLNGSYEQGPDYEKIEQAVLLKPTEYDVNKKLGYISLRSPVSSSKILAVAYEYEYKGKVYQVGEFTSDGIEHPDVLIVKLLKGTQSNPAYHNWDLMMKNVYAIGSYQISSEDFVMDVLYQDDRTGAPIPYLSEGNLKGKSLISALNLDQLSSDLQPYSDGLFDFVEGVTIKSSRGLIYFPVLEPFGSSLEEKIGDDALAKKYVYNELYDSTQSAARQVAEKNKFILKGSYKSSVSSEISLNTTQVKSVKVMCGGLTLVEGSDYTVDYSSGTVSIINAGILESGSNINITYENDPLFSTTTKTYMGTRAEYRYSDKISFGGTLIHLSEVPSVAKVGFDEYPICNTIWGLDAKYSTESMFLTKLVDKIPLINTKEMSYVEASAEFAQLLPGQSKHISDAVSIDDFESSEGRIYLREPTAWKIASTPQGQKSLFPEASLVNDLAFNYNKALISWYNINTSFYERSSPVSKSVQAEQFSRTVYQSNLFPNRDLSTYEDVPMTLLNIAYYPYERGQNNYDTKGRAGISAGLNSDGRLNNPASRWGGIMQSLTTTDFEASNVEYIEFWMMDPFINDEFGLHKGGDFYINIGRISEDVLRDGRKSAENGMVTDKSRLDETVWGMVPNYSIVETGFSSDIDRKIQDVGLDGLSDMAEKRFFAQYLQDVKEIVTPEVFELFEKDPSHDDFSSYLDNRGEEHDIVWRYKYFNGTDGNSPSETSQGLSTYRPDVEDLNQDNTLQETEAYYQYHISLRPEDMVVGKNFIEDETIEVVNNDHYQTQAKWYQFKIPINSEEKERIGNISDFRDISSMRMFLRNFNDSIVLRIAEFALVYSNWRVYEDPLFESGEYDLFSDSKVDISSVNIEENSSRSPVNYVLPPGVDRVIDPTSTTLEELNESALSMKVIDLEDGNSKAIYKQVNKDFRQFGSLEMFVHAEALIDEESMLNDGDLYAFIRLGSDYVDNYYEYEIPLKLTPHIPEGSVRYNNNSHNDRLIVWPADNKIELPFSVLTDIKLERNKMIADGIIPDLESYHTYSISHNGNRVSIKGNPNIGNVRTVMLGVRNRKKKSSNLEDDGLKKSGIVWFNELRLTDMNDQSGWATVGSVRASLADFATVSLAGKVSKPGFGSVDQKVFERSTENLYQYDVASSVSLQKFFPESWKLMLPFYIDLSETYIRPQYDPTNPDITLEHSLSNLTTQREKDSLLNITQDFTQNFSYNFTNVKIARTPKKQHPFNISNFSGTFAYNRYRAHDVDYQLDYKHQYKAAFNYAYNMRPKNYQPFKSNKIRIIKDFNFYLLPSSVSFKSEWDRTYKEQQRRNLSAYTFELPKTASKWFYWYRTYNVNYPVSKGLKLSYNATNNSRLNEPSGVIDKTDDDVWREYKREIWNSAKTFGENMEFVQKWNLTWQVPINKFSLLDWTTVNYKFAGSYNWQMGTETMDDELDYGNFITNTGTHTVDGTLNFSKLYTKSKYLAGVQKRMKQSDSKKNTNQKKKETVKFTKSGVKTNDDNEIVINHKLGTTDVKVTVLDENGQLVPSETEVISPKKVKVTCKREVEKGKVTVTGKKDVQQTALTRATDKAVNTLMMFKTATINYTQAEGSFVPGYKYDTKILGLNKPFSSSVTPGWGYVFGFVPSDLESHLNTSDWLVDNDNISDKLKYTYSNRLKIQSSLEPIKNMKVTLSSERSFSKNYTKYLWGDATENERNKLTNGNFSISANTLASAFNSDKAYERFKENRLTIAHRLAQDKFGGLYETDIETGFPSLYNEISQDVLIPAFFSAYTGQSVDDVDVNTYFTPMFSSFANFLRSLNWKVTYNGLSKLPFFSKYFKTVNINHAYTSTYNMGAYETFSSANTYEDEFYIDPVDGSLYVSPDYDVSTVSISERLNPLIGFDSKMKNNVTAKVELRRNRTVTLSFTNTEISEVSNYEYVVGAGYVFDNFKLNITTSGKSHHFENDLTIRLDFSVRDNQTIRRNIAEDITRKISGTKSYALKTYAEYMLNERITFRLYLDYTMNQPLTNGYRTSTTSGGVNMRFSLM